MLMAGYKSNYKKTIVPTCWNAFKNNLRYSAIRSETEKGWSLRQQRSGKSVDKQ